LPRPASPMTMLPQGEFAMAKKTTKKKARRRPLKALKDAVVKTVKKVFGRKNKKAKKKATRKKT
jgi:hypothetical protein